MTKGRMEAFSDGVFAVIITIMVLEMKSPSGHWACCFAAAAAGIFVLCAELRLCGDLLEQSSSFAAGGAASFWGDTVG